MGLDLVELVMDVEETFGIKLEDDDLSRAETVQDLHDVIVRKRPGKFFKSEGSSEAPPCLSLVSFVRLRRAMMSVFQLPRESIRPATPVFSGLVPAASRRDLWLELEHVLKMRLPGLERPRWMQALLGIGWLPLCVFLFLVLAIEWNITAAIALVPPTIVLTMIAARKLTAPLAVCLEPDLRTVGGLARRVVALNYRQLADEHPLPAARSDEVMELLVRIISENLNIPPQEIKRTSRFIEDLKCD